MQSHIADPILHLAQKMGQTTIRFATTFLTGTTREIPKQRMDIVEFPIHVVVTEAEAVSQAEILRRPSFSMDDRDTIISRLLQRLPAWRKQGLNESQTRACLIDPMLEALGWNIGEPEEVSRNHLVIGGTYADYALMIEGIVRVVVEAKALGTSLNSAASAQVLEYCGKIGAEYGAVTNGEVWKVFAVRQGGTVDNRTILDVTLTGESSHDTNFSRWDALRRISKDNIGPDKTIQQLTLKSHARDNEDPQESLLKTRQVPESKPTRADSKHPTASGQTNQLQQTLETFILSLGSDVRMDSENVSQRSYWRGMSANGRFCRVKELQGGLSVMLTIVRKGLWQDMPAYTEYDNKKKRPYFKVYDNASLNDILSFVERAYSIAPKRS